MTNDPLTPANAWPFFESADTPNPAVEMTPKHPEDCDCGTCAPYETTERGDTPTVEECEAAGRGPSSYEEFREGGLPDTPEERALFEAYMRGHCWSFGNYSPNISAYDTTMVRMLYGVWRDRGALAQRELAAANAENANLRHCLEVEQERHEDTMQEAHLMLTAIQEYIAAYDNASDPQAVGSTCRLIRAESDLRDAARRTEK